MNKTKKGFWGVFVFYFLVAFEFAYMAGPFAVYFYSVYSPVLNFMNRIPALSWMIKFFLPHVVRDTSSPVINSIEIIGLTLSILGFLIFVIGACQIYYSKLTKKGAVSGGLYKYIRHPQYTSFIVCSFGLMLLWPRYIVIFFFVTLVFGYYFLARAEEIECEKKFGESFIEYERKTGRFFPKRKNAPEQTDPSHKMDLGKIFVIYLITLGVFYLGAFGLNRLTLNSLYSISDDSSVTVSLCEIDAETMENIISIAKNDTRVNSYLTSKEENRLSLNYILPTEWFAAEIPMTGVVYRSGHKSPANYDHNRYKIIFITPTLLPGENPSPSDILSKTIGITPLVEVWVDIDRREVIEIKEMPENIKYDGIPEAIY